MLIKLKNKNTLIIDDFKLKCSIGIRGINSKKKEGDLSSPKGKFKLGNLYYRSDRVEKPKTKLNCIKIHKYMGWCNDPKSKKYNNRVNINYNFTHEKLFRKDHKYNAFIVINYNSKPVIKNKGSAIFLHLTKNYKSTAGCIAIKENDFFKLARIIKSKTKIKI